MGVIATTTIERMSVQERLQAMELLWRSLSSIPKAVTSPSWHGEVLAKRVAKVRAGHGRFLTIRQLKDRLAKTQR